jgi:ABC-2 type transport system permease protein
VGRYWRIYRTFFSSSLVRELEYRANFIAATLSNFSWAVFYLLMILVIFSQTKSVAGWTREMVFVLMGTVFLMTSLHGSFFFSCFEIPEQVRKGTLDFVITRPVDSQFWVSLRRFKITGIGSMAAAVMMVAYGVAWSGSKPGLNEWAAYGVGLLLAVMIYYSFGIFLMTLAIYFVRIDNLWVLAETTAETARYPVDIYRVGIANFFVFYVPLGFLATVPSESLIRGARWDLLFVGLVWAVAFFVGARWFWNWSLSRYTSASS